MGKKYETVLSGGLVPNYNDNPPPDDGSKVVSNLVKFATVTSDLTDPLNASVIDIDDNLTAMLDRNTVAKVTNYTTVESDLARAIEVTGSGVTISLLAPSGNGGYWVPVKNDDASNNVTVDVADASLIDGQTTITLAPGHGGIFTVNEAEDGYLKTASAFAFLDEDAMGSDDAFAVASQQSIKAYVDAAEAASQPLDAELTALSGLVSAADKVPRFTGSGTADLIDFLDEDNMASDSTTAIPTQQSVKAYVDGTGPLPSGTVMAFFQASAPTGWTQNVSHNDKALRVVSGTGGGSGGTHGLSSPPSTVHNHNSANHTHSLNSHTHSGPSHNHKWYNYYASGNTDDSYTSGGALSDITSDQFASSTVHIASGPKNTTDGLDNDYWTAYASGTTGAASGNTGTGGNLSTTSDGPTAFAPDYIDVIIASKD